MATHRDFYHITERDVGKRVYYRSNCVQVENDAQFAARGEQEAKIKAPTCGCVEGNSLLGWPLGEEAGQAIVTDNFPRSCPTEPAAFNHAIAHAARALLREELRVARPFAERDVNRREVERVWAAKSKVAMRMKQAVIWRAFQYAQAAEVLHATPADARTVAQCDTPLSKDASRRVTYAFGRLPFSGSADFRWSRNSRQRPELTVGDIIDSLERLRGSLESQAATHALLEAANARMCKAIEGGGELLKLMGVAQTSIREKKEGNQS